MSDFLRVALLGGGKMAHQHAVAIRHCRGARVVAVVDPAVPPEELKSRFGADVVPYSDVKTMLAAEKPDVVHVVTPPATHAELARICLEAGANVYVEKPFALNSTDAESVLRLAESRGLRVCAAHQVLFQDVGRTYRQHLPMIGDIVHVESFFSFRPVRKRTGGGGLSTPVDQLIDILPHPVYLLLDALPADGDTRAEVTALDVSIDGEVRAVIRRGKVLATLVVSLNARPVESWLRVMGKNGMVEADFVLGTIIRHPGPGASAPSVVLKPFSRSWQIGWGSFKAVLKLIFRRHKSYPGLAELLESFYAGIRAGTPTPITAAEITDTVRLCETISARLHADERVADERAARDLLAREATLPPLNDRGIVLLTGGTGMLGEPTAKLLRQHGWRVRVPVRRNLSPRHMSPGIEYVRADLAASLPTDLMNGVDTVVHLAAETAGVPSDHERNTVRGTQNLLDMMTRHGVKKLINISSVAVLRPSMFGRILNEDSIVDFDNLTRGPYVWAKAKAEQIATGYAKAGHVQQCTIRLGPLIEYRQFAPPGRLGREVARLFVAMGRASTPIFVCGVDTAARAIVSVVSSFDSAPQCVNLNESPPPTRGDLVHHLRKVRPDLRIMWLPFWILFLLGVAFRFVLRLTRPSKAALDLYAAFRPERYDTTKAAKLIALSRNPLK